MTTAAASPSPRHAFGVLLVLGAGLIWSTSGPLIRAVEAATVWQVLFYKMFWLFVMLVGLLAYRHRGAFVRVLLGNAGWTLLAAICLVVSNVGWILSVTSTSVANTLLLQAAAPLVAALLARALLGERLVGATMIAMAFALTGIAIMIGEGALDGRLFGNVAGVIAMVGFAAFAVTLRAGRMADATTALLLGALIATAIGAVMADDLGLGLYDHVLCFLMGAIETGIGLVLFTVGARYVPAGELMLLTMIEIGLGPLFVWLLYAEVPSAGTLLGGGLVVAAIVGLGIFGLRRTRGTL